MGGERRCIRDFMTEVARRRVRQDLVARMQRRYPDCANPALILSAVMALSRTLPEPGDKTLIFAGQATAATTSPSSSKLRIIASWSPVTWRTITWSKPIDS